MSISKTFLIHIIKILLGVHSFSYRVAGFLSQKVEESGIHPKHRLMNYHKFFVDNIDKDDVVLDVGCGSGALSYDDAKKAKKVVGIDLNEKNISFAKQRYSEENIEYICGDALKDLPNEKFDVIIMSNVLEHIKNRVEFLDRLKE
jgi:2-polyprenyl-3-methyl-5-hydroxy-6-metoxy-1,4-benzoquinol methylase